MTQNKLMILNTLLLWCTQSQTKKNCPDLWTLFCRSLHV